MYKNLFSPIKINNLEIKNRTAYPSLGLLFSYDGKLNDRYIEFYRERAHGGVGLLTVGPVSIDFLGSGGISLSLANDEAIPSFTKLAKIIKEGGASPWVQLFHAGAYTYSFLLNGEKALAPSAIYSKYSKDTPKEMTAEDINTVQEAFIRTAERAQEAGFEGVEIIGSAGYLITQFLSPLKNKRTDEYGGSFENRTRFPVEIIEKMRKRLGNDYPIGIRMAGNDFVPESTTDEETPRIAELYEKAGIDIINVTGGWHESRVPQLPMELPRGAYSYLALNIKRAVSVPVISSNRISDPELAEQIITDGMADMVNLGRVLIADPKWPQKALEGRSEEIRPCVACSQGCTDQVFAGKPVFCLANPEAGYEGERKLQKTKKPQKVMIIGAGPGGLEAAITASRAGHTVELYDRDSDIGGQIIIAGRPPHKQELWEFIRYYKTMLGKHPVNMHLNTEVTTDMIKKIKPDHVIVAEGAAPMAPPINGLDDPKVLSSWEVLKEDPALGKRVAVIGGGSVGLETAHFLANKGTLSPEVLHFLFKYNAESIERLRELMFKGSKDVTVFEMLPKVGKDVGKSTKWVLLGNLDMYGVNIIPNAKVLSVKNSIVDYETPEGKGNMEFDNVIIASGSTSVKTISDKIKKTKIPFTIVGDSARPAKMSDAIHEGYLAIQNLG